MTPGNGKNRNLHSVTSNLLDAASPSGTQPCMSHAQAQTQPQAQSSLSHAVLGCPHCKFSVNLINTAAGYNLVGMFGAEFDKVVVSWPKEWCKEDGVTLDTSNSDYKRAANTMKGHAGLAGAVEQLADKTIINYGLCRRNEQQCKLYCPGKMPPRDSLLGDRRTRAAVTPVLAEEMEAARRKKHAKYRASLRARARQQAVEGLQQPMQQPTQQPTHQKPQRGSAGQDSAAHSTETGTPASAQERLPQPTQPHLKRQRGSAGQDRAAHSTDVGAGASAALPTPVLPHKKSCLPMPVESGHETQGAIVAASTRDCMQGEGQDVSDLDVGAATLRLQFESIMKVLDQLSSLEDEKKGIDEQMLLLQGRAQVAEAEMQEAIAMYTAQLRHAIENEGV